MRDWIPSRSTAKGRLVLAALEAFGRDGFDEVAVADLAEAAETTTGPLYHHFGSKLGLYTLVRDDVERRVLDRMEGALEAGAKPGHALVVAFEYARRAGYVRMLSEPHPAGRTDPVAATLTDWLADAPEPMGAMLAAAWRAALAASAKGAPDAHVRAAIRTLNTA